MTYLQYTNLVIIVYLELVSRPFQIVTLCSLGLDLPRGVLYGFCSLLAPVGYGRCRDPDGQPLGISLMPGYSNRFVDVANCGNEGDRSPEQVSDSTRKKDTYLQYSMYANADSVSYA